MNFKTKKAHFIAKILLVFLSIPGVSQSVFTHEIYISPLGNDLNKGTKSEPLATIAAAKEKAYDFIQSKEYSDITVWLYNGVYQLHDPVVFQPVVINDFEYSIQFRAMPESHPVISGGMQLSHWEKNDNGFWETELPEVNDQKMNPRELFISGQRAKRARFPNEGYLHVKQVGEDRRTNFVFEENDFPIPHSVEDLELVVLHDWSISRNSVKEIDKNQNRLITNDSIGARNPDFFNLDHWEPHPRYFLENAVEFLDEDYEWIFNSEQNKIIAKFPENGNPNQIETTIPVSEGIIVF